MDNGQGVGVARGIRTLWESGTVGGMSDAQLLDRFVERRDEAGELAFEALVGRHGPMVLRVARDVLRDPHSAEDAFQATFLVLARKARSIARPETLGPWLHGVAHRVARKARVEADRRRRHEVLAAGRSPRSVEPDQSERDFEHSKGLHEEIAKLPNACRVAVVLCYFEGLTYDQAARRLDVTESTVRGRLARARRHLRGRLAARGATAWSLPMVPGRWIGPTARAASRFARGIPGEVPAPVVGLAEGVLRIMTISQLKTALLLVAFHAFAVAGVLARQQQSPAVDRPEPPRHEVTSPSPHPERPARAVDQPARLTMTLDQAIDRFYREDVELRSKFVEIPSARADLLTAGLRANPDLYARNTVVRTTRSSNPFVYADHDLVPYGVYQRIRSPELPVVLVNAPPPLDLTRKRAARTASAVHATRVVEAQYLDLARLRFDALASAFGEALRARDLAEIGREAVGRLGTLADLARERGEAAEGLGQIEEAKQVAEAERDKADQSLDRALQVLASLLALPEGQAAGLEVVGKLGQNSHAPALDLLISDARATRPDLLACWIGLSRAKDDPEQATVADNYNFSYFSPSYFLHGTQLASRWHLPKSQLADLEQRISSDVKLARRELEDSLADAQNDQDKAVAARYAFETAWSRYSKKTQDLAGLLAASRSVDEAARARVEVLARNYRSRVALNTSVGRRVVQP